MKTNPPVHPVNPVARAWRGLWARLQRRPFTSSADYWRNRYRDGGDSGPGSYGKFAAFKAEVLNRWFARHGLQSAVEFGCGDGNQLALLQIDGYLGVDLSADAVERCRAAFAGQPGRRFVLAADYGGEQADCALSLDVIYHLVEDAAFDAHMRQLFAAARRMVVVYASNFEPPSDESPGQAPGAHVRHRCFTDWVAAHAPHWQLAEHLPNRYPYRGDYREGSFADFHRFVPREHGT